MLHFIINPVAGGKLGKKTKRAVGIIESRLKETETPYKFYFTEKSGDAKSLTEKLCDEGVPVIVAVGGDGTLHEIINGFKNFDKTALGIIPCGTGNDFAAALKIPEDVKAATDLLIEGKPQFTDFMQMPTVRGLNIIGTGVDVDVLKRYAALKKKTKFGYTKCLIKSLFHIKMTEFSARFNGEKKDYVSFIACVANGHRYGGGIPICPVADATDGKLDFVAVKEIRGLKILGAFIKLKRGKVLTLKTAEHELVESVKIIPDGDYTVQVDGELYDNIPFEVKVVSDKLRVFRP